MSRRRQKNSGVKSLYFIACDDSRYVKIGLSQDVRARLSELQGANAECLSLLLHFPIDDEALEIEMHQALQEFRMCGEWFQPNPWLNQAMLKLRAGAKLEDVIAWLNAELKQEAA